MLNQKLMEAVEASTSIILDIEGTTTSFDFTRNELLKYGEQHMQRYLTEHWNDSLVQKVIKEVVQMENKDVGSNLAIDTEVPESQEIIVQQLLDIMKKGQRTSSSKELEGLVWKNGFINGDLVGHVYPDVADVLRLWSSQGKKIFIYSNGSVEAQQLLFRHSILGNLEKYLHGHFDTNIGSKLESASYAKICQTVGILPNESVFFSDRPLEIVSAKQAGLQAILVIRHPDSPNFVEEMECLANDVPIINSFLEVVRKFAEEN